jgi:hypothetical protein
LKAPCFDVSKLDKYDQGMFGVTYTSSKIREMMRILKTRVPGQRTIIFVSILEVHDVLALTEWLIIRPIL